MTERPSGYARQKSDQYMTPLWAPNLILKKETLSGTVVDPACGTGNLIKSVVLNCPGACVLGFDTDPEFYMGPESIDFLDKDWSSKAGVPSASFILNPPYGLQGRVAVKFIELALERSQMCDGKVIALLPVAFDSGSTRTHLFRDCPAFKTKYVMLDRIEWDNLDPSPDGHGSTKDHAWFVWDWNHDGPPTVEYLQLPAETKAALKEQRLARLKALSATSEKVSPCVSPSQKPSRSG